MLNTRMLPSSLILLLSMLTAACGTPGPDADALKDSFAQQLASNKTVTDFQKSADDLQFTGPGTDGPTAKWRVHIDSAVIEPNSDAEKPYKGTVRSSWYANDQKIEPAGNQSHLPRDLISTGLAQDCWALWNKNSGKWEWE